LLKVEKLKKVPLFENLSQLILRSLVYYIKRATFEKEHILIDFDEKVQNLYFVEEGCVKIYNRLQNHQLKSKPGDIKHLRGTDLVEQYFKKPLNKEDAFYEVGVVDNGDSIGEEFIMSNDPSYFRAVVKSASCSVMYFSIQDIKMCLPNCIEDYRWFSKICKERKKRYSYPDKGDFIEGNVKSKQSRGTDFSRVAATEQSESRFETLVLPKFVRAKRIAPINNLFVKIHGLESNRTAEADLDKLLQERPLEFTKPRATLRISLKEQSIVKPVMASLRTLSEADMSPKQGALLTAVNLTPDIGPGESINTPFGAASSRREKYPLKISEFFDRKQEQSASIALPSLSSRSKKANTNSFLMKANQECKSSRSRKEEIFMQSQSPKYSDEAMFDSPRGALLKSPITGAVSLDERLKSQLVKISSKQLTELSTFQKSPVMVSSLNPKLTPLTQNTASLLKRKSCFPALHTLSIADQIIQ